MSPGARDDHELIDETVLAALVDELYGRRDVAVRFASDFVSDLPARCRRMIAACLEDDREELYRVALSIRTSAQMVGARRLAADAAALCAIAMSAPPHVADGQAALVAATSRATIVALAPVIARLRDS
jgi:hypothetical protein